MSSMRCAKPTGSSRTRPSATTRSVRVDLSRSFLSTAGWLVARPLRHHLGLDRCLRSGVHAGTRELDGLGTATSRLLGAPFGSAAPSLAPPAAPQGFAPA